MTTRRVMILGSTGSIGRQTLEVIDHLNGLHQRGQWFERYEVVALAARANAGILWGQASQFGVNQIALCEASSVSPPKGVACRVGSGAATELVREVPCDLVVGAIVGSAGLEATLAAVTLGRDVALANKESLVCGGELVVSASAKSGARLFPVDSEHSAVWQCLEGVARREGKGDARPPLVASEQVVRVLLTASGGPFRGLSPEEVFHATPAQALAHPTWSMGPKVTIDSATLMNKGLELIEARWLFGLEADRLGAIVHPQSLMHCIVEFADGSVGVQMASPDMRTPIQYALTFPHRIAGISPKISWPDLRRLDFDWADGARFAAIDLALRVLREGGTAGAIFNAANEEAVHAFLRGAIPFGRIIEQSAAALDHVGAGPIRSLDDVQQADRRARELVRRRLGTA